MTTESAATTDETTDDEDITQSGESTATTKDEDIIWTHSPRERRRRHIQGSINLNHRDIHHNITTLHRARKDKEEAQSILNSLDMNSLCELAHRLRDDNRKLRQEITKLHALLQNEQDKESEIKRLNLTQIADHVRTWPEVCGVTLNNSQITIQFLPVVINGTPTTPQRINILRESLYLEGTATGHPHIYDYVCTGTAKQATYEAQHEYDLLALLTVIRQLRLGFDQNSQLNLGWRSDSHDIWADHNDTNCPDWDGNTLQDDDSGLICTIEQYFGRNLSQILLDWNAREDRPEDENENEDDDSNYLGTCNNCEDSIYDDGTDTYTICEEPYCEEYLCSEDCYHSHMTTKHDLVPCDLCNNNFTSTPCEFCNDMVCDNCMKSHGTQELVDALVYTINVAGQPHEDTAQGAST